MLILIMNVNIQLLAPRINSVHKNNNKRTCMNSALCSPSGPQRQNQNKNRDEYLDLADEVNSHET